METEEPGRTGVGHQGNTPDITEVSNSTNEERSNVIGTSLINGQDVSLKPTESSNYSLKSDGKNELECSDEVGNVSNIESSSTLEINDRKPSYQNKMPADELDVDGTIASHMQGDRQATRTDVAETSGLQAAMTDVAETSGGRTAMAEVTEGFGGSVTTTHFIETCDSQTAASGVTETSNNHGTSSDVTKLYTSLPAINVEDASDSHAASIDVTETCDNLIATTDVSKATDSPDVMIDVTETCDNQLANTDATETCDSQASRTDVTETYATLTTTTDVTEKSDSQTEMADTTETCGSQAVTTDVTEARDSKPATTDVTETCGSQTSTTDVTETLDNQSAAADATKTCDREAVTTGVTGTSDNRAATTDVTAACDGQIGRASVIETSGYESTTTDEPLQNVITAVDNTTVGAISVSSCLPGLFGTSTAEAFICEDPSAAYTHVDNSPCFDYRHKVLQPLYPKPQPDNQDSWSLEDDGVDVTQKNERNYFEYSDHYPAYGSPEYYANKKAKMETMSDLIRRQQVLLNKLFEMRLNLRREERQLKTLKNEFICYRYGKWGDVESEFDV